MKVDNHIPIRIGNKEIIVELADNPSSRRKGLKGREDAGNGMLLDFNIDGEYTITMKDVPFNLDLIFIGNDRMVKDKVKALSNNEDLYYINEQYRFVLELPEDHKHKIRKGDLLGITVLPTDTKGKLHVLDTNGDTQQIISGNNRIFSRKDVEKFLKLIDNPKKLGKAVLDALDVQDNNEEEYVNI
jgi:uncharacterized membrane protein (UPF0127 family)